MPRRDGVCTSINFNFRTWYNVETRFSDNPQQKETIDDIIWLWRKKYVIYRLDIIFSITQVAQLMVSKIKKKNVEGYLKRCTKLHTMSGSWNMAMTDRFYVALSWDVMRNCSLWLWKPIKFQSRGAKIFPRKFYQI